MLMHSRTVNSTADIKNTGGGAIFVNYGGTVTITGGLFEGAGIDISVFINAKGTSTIKGCTIKATGDNGSAIRNGPEGGTVFLSSSAKIFGDILGTITPL